MKSTEVPLGYHNRRTDKLSPSHPEPFIYDVHMLTKLVDLSQWPGVHKWVQRIDARPAVIEARQGPGYSIGAPAEKMKELFQQMRAKVDALKGTDKHES